MHHQCLVTQPVNDRAWAVRMFSPTGIPCELSCEPSSRFRRTPEHIQRFMPTSSEQLKEDHSPMHKGTHSKIARKKSVSRYTNLMFSRSAVKGWFRLFLYAAHQLG